MHEEASWSHGVMVSTQDSESCNPSSNLGGTLIFFAQEKGNEKKHGKGKRNQSVIPCGLVVRIRRFHRRGRGSIPRMGGTFLIHSTIIFIHCDLPFLTTTAHSDVITTKITTSFTTSIGGSVVECSPAKE